MATPVKNFTDPTGVFRMLSSRSIPITAGISIIKEPGRMQIVFLPKAASYLMFQGPADIQAGDKRVGITNEVRSKLPPPPMGRQILLTFPPIYKERAGATIGQVYPPPAP